VAARIASTLLVVGLLAGTAAAFAITERLKLVRSPITAPRIDPVIGPLCECPRQESTILFRLRERDVVTLTVVNEGDRPVRTLFGRRPAAAGDVEATWDGRDDAGEVVPEGEYRPRIRLEEERRTITLPAANAIRVDTTPPEIRVLDVRPRRLSPGVGAAYNRLAVRYEVSEPARALLFVDGERTVYTYRRPLSGELEWWGSIGGTRVPAGTYTLELAAEDVAGNVSPRVPAGTVEVSYVTLGRTEVRVDPGARFSVDVHTDADEFEWRFAGGRGSASSGALVLRAPRAPGRYTLFVEAAGRGARAEVVVGGG
jgi:hypothetical protein